MLQIFRRLGGMNGLRLAGFHARRLSRRLRGAAALTYRDVAERQWTLSPAETVNVTPAIFLEGQLERVIDDPRFRASDHVPREHIDQVTRRSVEHLATVAYQLKDAWILDGSVWKGSARNALVPRNRLPEGFAPMEEVETAALACTFYGNVFWGRWIKDDVLLHLAARNLAPPMSIARPAYLHEQGYAEAFQLQRRSVDAARIADLIMIDDRGKNSSRTARYQVTRGMLEALVPTPSRSRVFLRRGTTGAGNRRLLNEEDVTEFLAKRGFQILAPESMRAEEIIRALRGADLVMGVEGSACSHALHTLSEGGTLFVLQPPYRFTANYKVELDCIRANFAFVVGLPEQDGFVIPLDDLGRTLDRIDRAGGAR